MEIYNVFERIKDNKTPYGLIKNDKERIEEGRLRNSILDSLRIALKQETTATMIQLLVEEKGAGVRKNDNNPQRLSVLEIAIKYQASLETIKILVENGADVTKGDNGPLSVLKRAYNSNISKEVIDYIESERDKKLGKKQIFQKQKQKQCL